MKIINNYENHKLDKLRFELQYLSIYPSIYPNQGSELFSKYFNVQ